MGYQLVFVPSSLADPPGFVFSLTPVSIFLETT